MASERKTSSAVETSDGCVLCAAPVGRIPNTWLANYALKGMIYLHHTEVLHGRCFKFVEETIEGGWQGVRCRTLVRC
jgi:hypothetical protein